MRRANTTFVNLRAALDDVDPLVDASEPVARRLGPFLAEPRGFAADAKPTVRDLSADHPPQPGPRNDLIEFTNSFPPLARTALTRARIHGAPAEGAFPETVEAFNGGGAADRLRARRTRPTCGLARRLLHLRRL